MAKSASVLRIRQVRSRIGQKRSHREALQTLGLHRIGQVVECPDNPAVRGNVRAVGHLVVVEGEPAAAGGAAAAASAVTETAVVAESPAKKTAKKAAKKKTTKKKTAKAAKKKTKKTAKTAKKTAKKKASGGKE